MVEKDEKKPRKTTARQSRVKTTTEPVAKKAVRKTTRKKTVTKKTAEIIESTPAPVTTSTDKVARKAPTPIRDNSEINRNKKVMTYVCIAICLVVFGVSAAIGFSDDGVINVSSVIGAQNQKIIERAAETGEVAQTVSTDPAPERRVKNSGLVGKGNVSKPEPKLPKPVATSTASSSEAMATSSDVSVNDNDSNEPVVEAEAVSDQAVSEESAETPETETEVVSE